MNDDSHPIDKFGNNAIVACLACGTPYLAVGILNEKGRSCPHCGKSRAFISMKGDNLRIERVEGKE